MAATRNVPQTRYDRESFLYRSAISHDGRLNDDTSGPSSSSSPSSSLGAVSAADDVRTSSARDDVVRSSARAATDGSDIPPVPNRRDSLRWLSHAASTRELTNDLISRRLACDDGAAGGGGNEPTSSSSDPAVTGTATGITTLPVVANDERRPRNAGKYTVIAFVNSSSGGGVGRTLLECLKSHLGPSHVIDLHSCRPGRMPEDVLIEYARDPMVRLLACGGDGTCGWILSSLDRVWSIVLREEGGGEGSPLCHLHLSTYRDHLPLAIMPLGTGNDLSRQYGWGGTFQSHMKGRGMITSVERSKLSHLDTWRCIIMPLQKLEDEERQLIPRILAESHAPVHIMEGGDSLVDSTVSQTSSKLLRSLLEDDTSCETSKSSRIKNRATVSEPLTQIFDGSFCNYFSLGFDAAMAYRFHREREKHPERFSSSLKNKIVYVQKTPHALRSPKLRKRVKVLVNDEGGQLVELKVPENCRAILIMNIQSYAAGQHLTSKGSPEDALVEVVFVSNIFQAVSTAVLSPIMPFLLFKVAAQTNNVYLRTRCPLHCQVDGEPWLQGDGIISVKFHSRKAILEKVNDNMSCGCMGTGIEDNVIN